MSTVPASRVRELNHAALREDGRFVLYWMVASRRTRFNFGLQHAADLAKSLSKPLVLLEALRRDYPWASARLHRFVLDGMEDNAERCRKAGVLYYPYVEPRRGAGRGLLQELGRHACAVVTDDFPAFFLPRMIEAAARKLPVRLEAVDSNGLLPLGATDRAFPTAYAFRRFLQRELREHLAAFPKADPLARLSLPGISRLPAPIPKRWPSASDSPLDGSGRRRPPFTAGPGRRGPRCGGSSGRGSTATTKSGTAWMVATPAVFPPTCTSATSAVTRYSGRSWGTRSGRRCGSRTTLREAAPGGGACGRRPRPSWISS